MEIKGVGVRGVGRGIEVFITTPEGKEVVVIRESIDTSTGEAIPMDHYCYETGLKRAVDAAA